jgi:hypothetical protein
MVEKAAAAGPYLDVGGRSPSGDTFTPKPPIISMRNCICGSLYAGFARTKAYLDDFGPGNHPREPFLGPCHSGPEGQKHDE